MTGFLFNWGGMPPKLRGYAVNKSIKVGDVVRVVGNAGSCDFIDLSIGVEAEVVFIHEDRNYPIELLGYNDSVNYDEVEVVRSSDGE
jgi:hypothetical protein